MFKQTYLALCIHLALSDKPMEHQQIIIRNSRYNIDIPF